ncbi:MULTISPECIES: EscU/YscU/HrcU family type III secretion system export apparatus switch protein [unclassified Bacillus (in: firmicutes)]|uniref:EscU/YscU/HrcU family type III secretion system export apparatus switch protein n=1 Tax=unclassified Bacillus (in: firmicutes) TaxID=185979 RepID=UPI0008EE2911|nr:MULTISPECIES: EscU/YscU/HrcU family type III secretion system export apparatus switch protein [unclassified Bacillus (in: firmicutes)]SFA74278.1 flagellar biosynthesis protein [Bacillus sp. UNCCL13]SFQ64512.1 flagellar biosynthesis protein [Bacillus sp. cl95]
MTTDEKHSRREAVALGFQPERGDAPKVLARGKGLIADQIIDKAKENNVPIQEDPSLVGLLSELDINQSIPEELYQAVAEVFAFIYRSDREMQKRGKDG